VLAAARRNRRLAFVFPVAVVARGDAVIVSAFLSLWIVSGARDQGVDAAAALAHAGTALGAFTGGGLAGTLAAGYAVDRFDRAKTAMLAVLATGLAFGAAALVDDVMGWELVALAAVMGFAELSLIVSGQALLGEQAPPEIRGATVGVFAFCGAVSMLVLSGLGGQVFDRWTYAGPFILAGGLNLLVASWAWMGRREMAMNERTEHG
jgi:MFS family permease